MADEIRRLIRARTDKGARFKRDGFGKKPQLSDSWRKPRGQHNKQREQKKAKGALPKPGFGSPVAVRGMHPSGFFEILVYKTEDLEGLNPKTHAIRIARTVGGRKRAVIQEKALTAGLRVLNAKVVAPEKKPEQEPVEEKKAGKQEPVKEKEKTEKKKAKSVPAKEAKPAAAKKKTSVKKEKSAAKPEPAETPVAEEPKPKAKKPADKPAAKAKSKKESPVTEEGSADVKPVKKAAAKPKKKPVKEGEEQ